MTRRVVIAGGSGFLGRGLAAFLVERGWGVTVLSRREKPAAAADPRAEPLDWVRWDARTDGDWGDTLRGADAVVNLVGRSVDCRKTAENREVILRSRVDSVAALGAACRRLHAESPGSAPPVWVQGSTAHIVGDPEPWDRVCDESTPNGPLDEVAPGVGVAWEAAFDKHRLPEPTQRGVALRISFVLGRPNPGGAGALGRLGLLTRLGLGGTVGSGRQWMSWLHQDDLNRMVLHAIEDPSMRGVYMATAPEPVTNRDFMRALRSAYGRPWSPPAPALGVRLACRFVLNTDPELALLGRRCVPTRLVSEGFAFEHATLGSALSAVVG